MVITVPSHQDYVYDAWRNGDYYIPNLTVPDEKTYNIGKADIRSIKMLRNTNCDVVEHKLFFEAQIISAQIILHKTIDFFTKVWYHDNGDNNDYRFGCKK